MILKLLKIETMTWPAKRCRTGATMVELVVSAVLLITVMSFVTTLCFQINLVWKDIRHHRVALGELSNQLEQLTRLSPQQVRQAIKSLEPSAISSRTLKDPQLTGKLLEDDLGLRVVLQIDWQRRNPGKPVELAGWLVLQSGEKKNEVDKPESGGEESNAAELDEPSRKKIDGQARERLGALVDQFPGFFQIRRPVGSCQLVKFQSEVNR